MFKYFFAILFVCVLFVVSLAGFRGMKSTEPPLQIFPDMDDQPKHRPQHESDFFADGRAARPPVPGTVPIGYELPGAYFSTSASNSRALAGPAGFGNKSVYSDTGRIGDLWGDGIPLEVTPALVERGQERFNINCAICHGVTGMGNGIVKQYGLPTIASLQDPRIVEMPDGQIFDTITNGMATMGPYGAQIAVEDRWAIIAYLRALQRSMNASESDVPEQLRAQLRTPAAAGQPAEQAEKTQPAPEAAASPAAPPAEASQPAEPAQPAQPAANGGGS